MIFLTLTFNCFNRGWVTLMQNKTFVTFFILNKKKYTPFKKFLKSTKFVFTADFFDNQQIDFYNNLILTKKQNTNIIALWSAIQIILLPYWRRVVFKGKGFRMRKFKNSRKLTFNFGHSHWTKLRLRTFFIMFKRKRRQSQYFFCYYYVLFQQICQLIMNLRRINKYTKRGLRLKKQGIIRRFGKISQMLSAHNY